MHELPYGRNLDRTCYISVLNEKRGTCSIKHVLIYKLGCKYEIDVALHLAVFMMNKLNTPEIS
ncbi:hypothetical protein EJB10_01380 [Wolbachia endosymbiont of Brugia malayi]|uniref:hypothetical protein n=1 Tax=Wolbachia endosymbiont of Brugia malayi TaxID=80849 RepID=UPI00109D1235|nr:hypothetical protein [Wolbachia endosymbiont of Brugia malayi]QCB61491.1 hypothetical protein EJB10_01380 [Wolbachia endosymbiont of Brugia malayi]